MQEKQNHIYTISAIVLFLLIFTMADLLAETGLLGGDYGSGTVERPSLTKESFLSGEFGKQYEAYAADHFINRQKWCALREKLEVLAGKKLVNGVLMGNSGRPYEYHPSWEYPEELREESIAYWTALREHWDAVIMPIPTADAFAGWNLPLYADILNQKSYLKDVKEALGEDRFVDLYSALEPHRKEGIFFNSDPHMTTLGAYYAYYAWADVTDRSFPIYYDLKKLETVTDEFQGSFGSRIFSKVRSDELNIFPKTKTSGAEIYTISGACREGFYFDEFLDSDDPYRYFLGEPEGFLRIDLKSGRSKSLFVIKDSYADCIIPLLARHYGRIYLVDVDHFDGDVDGLINKYCEDERVELMVLGSVPGLMDWFERTGMDGVN